MNELEGVLVKKTGSWFWNLFLGIFILKNVWASRRCHLFANTNTNQDLGAELWLEITDLGVIAHRL